MKDEAREENLRQSLDETECMLIRCKYMSRDTRSFLCLDMFETMLAHHRCRNRRNCKGVGNFESVLKTWGRGWADAVERSPVSGIKAHVL